MSLSEPRTPLQPDQKQRKSRLILLPPEIRQAIFSHIFTPILHLHGEIPERHPILPQELYRLRLRLSPCLNPARPYQLKRRDVCVQQGCSHPDPVLWPALDHSSCLESDVGVAWMRCCRLVYEEASTVLLERTSIQVHSPEVLQRLAMDSPEPDLELWAAATPSPPSDPQGLGSGSHILTASARTMSVLRIRHLIISASISNMYFFVQFAAGPMSLLPNLRSLVFEIFPAYFRAEAWHLNVVRNMWESRLEPMRFASTHTSEVRVLGGRLDDVADQRAGNKAQGQLAEEMEQAAERPDEWSHEDREILTARLRRGFEGEIEEINNKEMTARLKRAGDKQLCKVSVMLDL